ncbi:hypothetical protein OHA59_42640 [Streptomyces sp. NBC_01589]|uniref:hypothetical protein n=1 Tax=Streptomyces sp. NBC_01589 TaxID=2975886 RepID=UPI00386B1461
MRRDQWLQAEGANWLAALRHAATAGEHATVVEVAEAMHWFSDQWICWGHWPEICRTATHSAQALGDPLLEATQLNYRASPCSCATAATITASPARPRPSPPRNAPTTWPSRHGPTTTPPGLFDCSATTRQPASTTPERRLFEAAGDFHGALQAMAGHSLALLNAGRIEEAIGAHLGTLTFLDEAGDRRPSPIYRPPSTSAATAATRARRATT